jgi:hypothetical protein
MKKLKFIYLFALASSQSIFAQVGIGTSFPQKALQISGTSTSTLITGTSVSLVTPTIRVDGLSNSSQGISNTKLKPVLVTDNGDLVVSKSLANVLLMIDPINTSNTTTDFLTSAVTTNASILTDTILKSFTFNITEPSLVNFNANTSIQLYSSPQSLDSKS